jgi:16S rRNA (guanine527-N7)-methyltransferase
MILTPNISRETIMLLEGYVELIYKWHKKINLVSFKSREEIWQRHINDSLQLLGFIKDKDVHLIDIGSGAGFPGIVLSIAGVEQVTLVESNRKKAAFLLQASKFSDNKILILNEKVEFLKLEGDILTTRGFSSLSNIFTLTSNYKIRNKYLLLKGAKYMQELSDARNNWSFNCNIYESATSIDGKILEINDISKIP